MKHFFMNYTDYIKKKTVCSCFPVVINVEPTNMCNLHCPMCPQTYSSKKRGFMDFSLYKKIIDEIRDHALEVKLYQGGEPLLHPKITDMIRYANKAGLITEIDSNATLLNEQLSEKLITSGLDYISFSFDGYDKKTYESIRSGADYEITLNNIIEFLKKKKQLRSKKPFVRIKSIVKKDDPRFSEDKRKVFLENFKNLEVNEFDSVEIYTWNTNTEVLNNPIIKPELPELSNKFNICPRLYSSLMIYWDGRVSACCVDFDGILTLGNLNKKSLKEIWNDHPIRNLREKFINKNLPEKHFCTSCVVPYETKTIFGFPITHMMTTPSLLKKYLGYKNYRSIYRKLRSIYKVQ